LAETRSAIALGLDARAEIEKPNAGPRSSRKIQAGGVVIANTLIRDQRLHAP